MKALILFLIGIAAYGQTACSSIPLGFNLAANGGSLGGFVPFPLSSYWHRDVSNATPDPASAAYIADSTQGGNRRFLSLYPASGNGGSGFVDGFFYHVVSGSQRRINVYYDGPTAIPGESDPGPMPIPLSPVMQGSLSAGNPFPAYNAAGARDGHVIVIDRDNCVLYELFDTYWDGHALHAGVGATFDLLGGDNQRPVMYTSGSVSGLPLLPGFLRDEELNGSVPINHPITISMATMAGSGNFYPKHSFISPAEHHQYGFNFNPWWHPANLPFGAILRLKASFDISGYPAQAQLILNAMKKYGVIFVDGGNTVDLYSAGGWNWDGASTGYLYDHFSLLQDASNFDVITSSNPIFCDPLYATTGYNGGNSPLCPNSTGAIAGAVPTINSFTASTFTVSAGQPVTLSWTVTGASTGLRFVTPEVGPVRGNSVIVNPQKTTTYTLMVQNYYGRTSAGVTINVSGQ